MADELNINISHQLTKNGATTTVEASDSVTVTSNAFIEQTISVGTANETLALGDVTTIGHVFLHNLDATNYVEIGSDGTNYPLKLKAGEPAHFRWNAAAVNVKANTAACLFRYKIVGD